MGYLQSGLTVDLCVNVRTCSCAPRPTGRPRHAYFAAPVRGRKAVFCNTLPGGARQGLIVGHVLQSAERRPGRTESPSNSIFTERCGFTDRQTGRQNSGFTHIHNTYSYRLQLHSTGGRIIAVHTVTESPCIFYVYNYIS